MPVKQNFRRHTETTSRPRRPTPDDKTAQPAAPTTAASPRHQPPTRRPATTTRPRSSGPQPLVTPTAATSRRNNMKHDVIAMVGLPARGKTFISKRIVRHLNERDFECRIFNVGEYRRLSTDYTTHDFFSSDNDHALQMRTKFAVDALEDLCSWLAKGDNRVAIYDATNSTKDRREIIYDTVVCKYNYNLLFIESICNKPAILDINIKHKTSSPDYSRFDRDYAIKDFKQRIAHYESRYKPLGVYAEEQKYSFIQIVNAGEDCHFHHCRSEVQLMLVHFLVDLYSGNTPALTKPIDWR